MARISRDDALLKLSTTISNLDACIIELYDLMEQIQKFDLSQDLETLEESLNTAKDILSSGSSENLLKALAMELRRDAHAADNDEDETLATPKKAQLNLKPKTASSDDTQSKENPPLVLSKDMRVRRELIEKPLLLVNPVTKDEPSSS